jgi:thiamine biosynthesis lipoprotein
MSTDREVFHFAGPTMGAYWQASLVLAAGTETHEFERAIAEAVGQVDAQMSTWKQDSDLMRLNRADVGRWISVPAELLQVLEVGLKIGRLSGGAFDIGQGDLVLAWGFGPAEAPNPTGIRGFLAAPNPPVWERLEIDPEHQRVRKLASVSLDLSGIAKGFAVDQAFSAIQRLGCSDFIIAIDGELRGAGRQPNGRPWAVVIEEPVIGSRKPASVLEIADIAIATSGDYRHYATVAKGVRLGHTMDPLRGGPVQNEVASATVLAPTCMEADAWATVCMVMGAKAAEPIVQSLGFEAVLITRASGGLVTARIGLASGSC